ncbi:MAG TPA: hypothetical protein VFM93_05070 [Candidatus Limnocylindria bacterium]|nr:hypothetical protein [Candidatus Limnocylindria bacterium]
MTRAALCGRDLETLAAVLRLAVADPPDVVIVDAEDEAAVERAARYPPAVPRVVIADEGRARALLALGTARVACSRAPHVVGPLVADAVPRRVSAATRAVVVTSVRGGVGRTLLATNLARRLALSRPVWLVDATGSGAAAWWLGTEAAPWQDLEALVGELTAEHLRIVAAEPRSALRLLGGAGAMPSVPLLRTATLRIREAEELLVVDAPPLADERSRDPAPGTRTVVLTGDDAASLASLDRHDLAGAWLVAPRSARLGREVFRTLPRDERAVADAAAARAEVGGTLGRAYDELAELVDADA